MKRQASIQAENIDAKQMKIEIGPTDVSPIADDIRHIKSDPSIKKLQFLSMKNGNRYTVGEYLGEGMFGLVMEISNQKNEKFAAKMIKATKDKPEVLKIELDMMEKIAADPHESILQLIAVEQLIEPPVTLNGTVIVTRVLGPSLLDIINSAGDRMRDGDEGTTFPVSTIRQVGRQICQAMIHLESLGIFHLDLKPENVYFFDRRFELRRIEMKYLSIEMVDARVQIGDFGCSRWHPVKGAPVKPTLVQTQNYRAPEIFMGLPHSIKSDVWSFAAILAEMYTGQLLFYGTHDEETEQSQFELMQMITSSIPSRRMWRQAAALESKKIIYVEKTRSYRMKKLPSRMDPTLLLHENIREKDVFAVPLFIFLDYMLVFDPIRRPSFIQCSKHRFFN